MGDNYVSTADKGIEVPFSDDEEKVKDDELIFSEDPPTASPAERVTHRKKREDRIKRLLDEGKTNADKVRELEERDQKRERELAELRGMVAANQNTRREPEGGKDEYQRRLDAVYERQGNAYASAQAEIKAGTFDEKRSRYYEQIAREIEEEKSSIHAERVLARREPVQRQEQAQQVWVQKYPDVYRDPRAFQYAQATYHRRRALGEPDTAELVEEVMGETMAQFRLGPKKAPSQSDRSRMSGLPSSGAGGGGGGGGSGIPMTKELRKMATALYSDLPEEQALKKWVDGPGKELRKQKVL